MNTNQINCFLEAAKENNFSRAAKNLYINQPNLSRTIAALEDELDVKLFVRYPDKSISLTEQGKIYYQTFRDFQTALFDAREQCNNLRTVSHTLRLGYVAGWDISDFLPERIAKMNHKYPNLEIFLECHPIGNMNFLLQTNQIDACLTLESSFASIPSLSSRKIYELPKVIIYSRKFIPVPADTITLEHFCKKTFYLYPREMLSSTKNDIKRWFSSYDSLPEIKVASNQETMVSAVENGMGVAIMDLWSQPVFSSKIAYHLLPDKHSVILAWRKDFHPDIIQDFCRILVTSDAPSYL